MEACELLKRINENVSIKAEPQPKRYYRGIYGKSEVDDDFHELYNPPPVEDLNNKKQKIDSICLSKCKLLLDLESLSKVCKDIKYPIVPTDCKLNFINEAINLFKCNLFELPNFKLKNAPEDDIEDCFKNFVGSFFDLIDSEPPCNVELDVYEWKESPSTEYQFNSDDDRKVIEQLFLSLILCYNWSLQLSHYTNAALGVATSNINDINPEAVLTIALGLKEANRNMAFYNSISHQLWTHLKGKNDKIDSLITNSMNKLMFIKQIINFETSYEPHAWNRLKSQINDDNQPEGVDMHQNILESIRKEMELRMRSKLECDYLRREYERVSNDLSQLATKDQEFTNKLESLKCQMSEMMSDFDTEPNGIGKINDSKKLPKPLYRILSHLHLYGLSDPLREMQFKVLKEDENYYFQMILTTPKDLLMPSYEASLKVFPLIFKFSFEDGSGVNIRLVSKINISGSLEGILNTFNGIESATHTSEDYKTWGFNELECENNINFNVFNGKLKDFYERGQLVVWKFYVLECYKSDSGIDLLEQMLPCELRKLKSKSKYTYQRDLVWKLENEVASVELAVVADAEELKFNFSNFNLDGKLEIVNIPIMDHFAKLYPKIKDSKSKIKALNTFSCEIYKYFGDDYILVNTMLLFESFRAIFDLISS